MRQLFYTYRFAPITELPSTEKAFKVTHSLYIRLKESRKIASRSFIVEQRFCGRTINLVIIFCSTC